MMTMIENVYSMFLLIECIGFGFSNMYIKDMKIVYTGVFGNFRRVGDVGCFSPLSISKKK